MTSPTRGGDSRTTFREDRGVGEGHQGVDTLMELAGPSISMVRAFLSWGVGQWETARL